MASADFSQFVVTTDRAPSVRPHGISPEPFPVYSPDLRVEVTVAFETLMLSAISSAGLPLRSVQRTAKNIERTGISGLYIPFLSHSSAT